MNYLSVCSGIEAATVAWKPLGWKAVAFAEIEPFPRAVLSHHYPDVPLHGDFTELEGTEHGPIDILVGGTPCQSFSVAGLRAGMADPRGNLALGFLGLAARARPTWVVWENVPGVLSSNKGRDFGAFLGALGELGYGFAYRVLDAQYFGVPQRRRRVFVVGHLGDWRRAAAVLFERESMSGNPPPSREAGARVAKTLAGGAQGRGYGSPSGSGGGGVELVTKPVAVHENQQGHIGLSETAYALGQGGGKPGQGYPAVLAMNLRGREGGAMPEHAVAALTANGVGTCGADDNQAQAGHLVPETATALRARDAKGSPDSDATQTLVASLRAASGGSSRSYVAYGGNNTSGPVDVATAVNAHGGTGRSDFESETFVAHTLRGEGHDASEDGTGRGVPLVTFRGEMSVPAWDVAALTARWAVRRLTVDECESLQGFPRGYSQVPYRGKPAADSPRYKALGNSMAVPVMRWIGERIQMVEAIQ